MVIALLRAIAEKLIPGLPESLHIAILQQTDGEGNNFEEPTANMAAMSMSDDPDRKPSKSVLQQVMQSDTARNDLARRVRGMYLSLLVLTLPFLG